jgi:hypothetical protein
MSAARSALSRPTVFAEYNRAAPSQNTTPRTAVIAVFAIKLYALRYRGSVKVCRHAFGRSAAIAGALRLRARYVFTVKSLVDVRCVASPAPRDTWRRIVALDDDAMPSQTPEWTETLPPQWRDASRLYETMDGRQIVLPLATRRRSPGSTVAGSYPPRLGFGGLVADRGVSTGEIAGVIRDLTSDPRLVLWVWPNPLQGEQWTSAAPPTWRATTRHAQVVDVRGGVDEVWARMSGNARRGVRRSERMGVTIATDSSGALLPRFFELYAASQARWARASHEPLWLARLRARRDNTASWERVVHALGDRCRVSVASWKGEPVASVIVVHGPNAHYTHGAMSDAAGHCYANYALHWNEMLHAIACGERYYHMGESGTSASLARFKQQFGAASIEYADYRYERLPLSAADRMARTAVKRVIGFREHD